MTFGARTSYINAGSALGVERGMEFDVFAQEKPAVHPESGAVLGTPDRKTGRIMITKAAEKCAVGRIAEGGGFRRKEVVRYRNVGEAP